MSGNPHTTCRCSEYGLASAVLRPGNRPTNTARTRLSSAALAASPSIDDTLATALHELALEARHGLVLLDAAGRWQWGNHRAREYIGLEYVRCVSERVVLSGRRADAWLRNQLQDHREGGTRHQPLGAMRLDPGPLVATLSRVGSANGRSEMFWLQLVDPTDRPVPPLQSLRAVYALTQTEALVAASLTEGRTLQEIARLRCVSVHTVRTHLRALFRKTSTAKQSDLIRVLVQGCMAGS